MNKHILYLLPLMGILSFAACTNDEDPILSNETGEIRFSVVDTTAVEITTKASFGLDVNTFTVSLTRGNEPVFSKEYGHINGPLIYSASPDYMLTAESCTEAEAESEPDRWGQARVYGEETFAIVAGDTTEVIVSCGLVNSSVKVDFSDFIKSTYKEYSMEIHTSDAPERSFTLDEVNHSYKTAYFNVGESGRTLYCTVNLPGFEKPFRDTVEMVPSRSYKLMVKVIGEAGDMSASLDIAVDNTLQEVNKPESINPYE